ncbi:MAG: hypothetical protein ACTSQI_08020 [Candidatus Helarchaeota archaeon]
MQTLRKQLDLDYKQIKLRVIANLLRLLVDIYGDPKKKEGLDKLEGEEILLEFPELEGSLIVRPHGRRMITVVGDSESPKARIKFRARDEKIYDVIEDMIKSSGRWGTIKAFFKYVIPRKIRIKGSLRAVMKFMGVLSIGNHEMYKIAKEKAKHLEVE